MTEKGISQGLALVPSGVFVLASTENGRSSAMLVSFVQQIGFNPPMIVIAVGRSRPVRRAIETSRRFAISIMGTGSKESLRRFWQGVPEDRDPFEGLVTETRKTGIPILNDAVGFLECDLERTTEGGDHVLYLGRVINGGRITDVEPMVRIRKNGFDY